MVQPLHLAVAVWLLRLRLGRHATFHEHPLFLAGVVDVLPPLHNLVRLAAIRVAGTREAFRLLAVAPLVRPRLVFVAHRLRERPLTRDRRTKIGVLHRVAVATVVLAEAALALPAPVGLDEKLVGYFRLRLAVVVALHTADRPFLAVHVVALPALRVARPDGAGVGEEVFVVRLPLAVVP